MLFVEAYYALLGCAFFLGVAKGFRTVYWTLVIPDYVPIERLAAASGMQSTFNSLFMWVGGSFIGKQIDAFITSTSFYFWHYYFRICQGYIGFL